MSLAARVEAAIADAGLPPAEVVLDPPKLTAHGDLTTPVAIGLGRTLGRPPLEVAAAIAAHLPGAVAAPPGFLNWTLPEVAIAPGPPPAPAPDEPFTRASLMGAEAGPVQVVGGLDRLADVPADVQRFWLQTRPAASPLELDPDLMVRETVENPSFYLAYTVQRAESIAVRAAAEGLAPHYGVVEPAGRRLAVTLLRCPDELRRQPQRRARYAGEVAAAFHSYYATQRVFGAEQASARLALVIETSRVLRTVLQQGLGVDPGRICRFGD